MTCVGGKQMRWNLAGGNNDFGRDRSFWERRLLLGPNRLKLGISLGEANKDRSKRSTIGLKILSSAIKVEVIFYLSGKVIRAAVTIRRCQMKRFQSFLQAVCFGQTRVTKVIFQPLLL